MIERALTTRVRSSVATRPCVLVTGARQVGKTTLLRMAFPDMEYVSFDNILLANSAAESPRAFLDRFAGPVIFDEVQQVPELLPAIKEHIDTYHENGRWVLTGSQRFELMKGISESLAGRITILHLETLSGAELRATGLGRETLEALPYTGGYPELW